VKRFTILGSGSSGGTPRIGGDWGGCDPNEPKNRRRRSSALVELFSDEGVTRVLIDTSPDLRDQLLDAGVGVVDAVVYTHSHADHTHGIDDLRVVYFNRRTRIPTYYDATTGADLHAKFGYCFDQPQDSNYVPILEGRLIEPYASVAIEGPGGVIEMMPFLQHHGNTHSLGFKIGGLVYATDVHEFPEASLPYLEGLDVLILDALRAREHPCHFSINQAVEVITTYHPKQAYLTHLHVDLDHNELNASLPEGIETAYDGLQIEFE
jgi:phosphoribosyl 1,2-cyclic phosphate phosphodiesterase